MRSLRNGEWGEVSHNCISHPGIAPSKWTNSIRWVLADWDSPAGLSRQIGVASGHSDFLENPRFPCSHCNGTLLWNRKPTEQVPTLRELYLSSRVIYHWIDTVFMCYVRIQDVINQVRQFACIFSYAVNLALMVCQSNSYANRLNSSISYLPLLL